MFNDKEIKRLAKQLIPSMTLQSGTITLISKETLDNARKGYARLVANEYFKRRSELKEQEQEIKSLEFLLIQQGLEVLGNTEI